MPRIPIAARYVSDDPAVQKMAAGILQEQKKEKQAARTRERIRNKVRVLITKLQRLEAHNPKLYITEFVTLVELLYVLETKQSILPNKTKEELTRGVAALSPKVISMLSQLLCGLADQNQHLAALLADAQYRRVNDAG